MLDGDPLSTIFPLILLASLQAVCFVGEVATDLVSEARIKRLSENGTGGIDALTKLSRIGERTRSGAFRCGSTISGFVAAIVAYCSFKPSLLGLMPNLQKNLAELISAAVIVLAGSLISAIICDCARRVFLQRGSI